MTSLDALRQSFSESPDSWSFPDKFISLGISEDVSIVLTGLRVLSIFHPLFYSRYLQSKNECQYQDIFTISRWGDDCDDADGWCDPPFEGCRIVLLEGCCPPMHVKRFPAGYEEALTYAYLTSQNAPEVVKWLDYFEFHPDLAKMVREEFNLQE